MKEFGIIDTFFRGRSFHRSDVVTGIGDDGAVVKVGEGRELVVTTDTLVEGVHFSPETPARAIGHKVLSVSLSDLASMGAEPSWYTLNLTMPSVDESWLEEFSAGLHELSEYYTAQLIGGDISKGPLVISITAHGTVPEDTAIKRNGAKAGDWLYVTGTLGNAGLALEHLLHGKELAAKHRETVVNSLHFPTARVLAGTALRKVASSAIDISDGLISEIKHICKASGVGAVINVDQIPMSTALKESTDLEHALTLALSAGDDYEILFSVSEERKGALEVALHEANVNATCIGQITGNVGKVELFNQGKRYTFNGLGHEHFSETSL